jgi:hypothetical protein
MHAIRAGYKNVLCHNSTLVWIKLGHGRIDHIQRVFQRGVARNTPVQEQGNGFVDSKVTEMQKRLIETRMFDIFRKEQGNRKYIRLYGAGEYWHASEESACQLSRIFTECETALF